jgi:Uncharacterized protein conserved in bacteria
MKTISSLPWASLYDSLNTKGFAIVPSLLSSEECEQLSGSYHDTALYRSIINMKRYRFGEGEYKYYKYPLPSILQTLREELYAPLSNLANDWMKSLGLVTSFPDTHAELILQCHRQQQQRPTPLILHYQTGGYNTLHQDLYGEIYFPFQVVFALTQHGQDFEGGELMLTEQVPRAQSKAEVIRLNKGDAVIITTNFRPVKGTRGYYRANVKHGVSTVKAGERYSLGIIFHDAV